MIPVHLLRRILAFSLLAAPLVTFGQEKESLPNNDPENIDTEDAGRQLIYKKKMPYSVVGVLGADRVLGTTDTWTVPVVRLTGYKEMGKSCVDVLVQADTLAAFAQVECRGKVGFGARTHYDYVAQGDYRHFDDLGRRLREKEVKANVLEQDLFLSGNLGRIVGRGTLGIGNKWYGAQEKTTIVVPAAHGVRDVILDVGYQDVEIKDIVIKEGLEGAVQLAWQQREGYQDTLRAFVYGGWFVNSAQNTNIKIEARAGIEKGADRENGWYLGSFMSRQAPAPGWNYMEIRHSPFAQLQASVGFALGRSYRLEPGMSAIMLFSPNLVKEGDGLSGLHPSAFAVFTGKIAGIVPFGIKYGYAPRTSVLDGGHEVFGYVGFALNKLEPDTNRSRRDKK